MKHWKHNEPRREDYATEEDYERALEAYEVALDNYLQECADARWGRL